MWFDSWLDDRQSVRQRGRPPALRRRCRRPCSAQRPLALEPLEERSLPSAVPPLPIPEQPVGPGIHAFLPGPADSPASQLPFGRDPSTITDFTGFVGDVHVQGIGTPTGGSGTDAVSKLSDVDLRFMQGVYKGVDGRFHFGTFVFVWLDTYKSSIDFGTFHNQTHDFDPGTAPNGVFWTAAIPNDDLKIDPFNGTAELHVQNLHLKDFFNLPNAVKDGPHDLGTVSFDVKWGGPVTETVSVQDRQFHFGGTFIENHATVTWSGRNDTTGFQFRSNEENFATTRALGGKPFAELGFESNGVFFQPDDSGGNKGQDGNAAIARSQVVPPTAQAAPTTAIDQAFADLAGVSFSDILRKSHEVV